MTSRLRVDGEALEAGARQGLGLRPVRASPTHAWIQGAIESGLRAALEVDAA